MKCELSSKNRESHLQLYIDITENSDICTLYKVDIKWQIVISKIQIKRVCIWGSVFSVLVFVQRLRIAEGKRKKRGKGRK